MQLFVVKIETSHEVEDALTVFCKEKLHALGTEVRKRSDFEQAGWLNDSTVVDLSDIKDLPKDMELIAYFDQETDPRKIKKRLALELQQLHQFGLQTGVAKITSSYITNQDWQTVWQKYYHVINFSRHLAIVPKWEHYQPVFKDQLMLKLDPGLAFGTGRHQTTQLALLALERLLTKPLNVIDVGTGSGILAIAADKLGASSVTATDISDEAMTAAKTNAHLNDLKDIKLKKTSLLHGVKDKYDLILANLLAELLLPLIPQLQKHLRPQGRIIFSGIDYLQLPHLKQVLTDHGFKIVITLRQKRWVCLIIERKA